MALTLYGHPFAAYTWKVVIALYENATSFEYRVVDDAATLAELESLWPLKKFPVLDDAGVVLIESSIIVEYLAMHHPGSACLMPEAPDAALDARFMDRFFDNYVMAPMQKIVADRLRAVGERDVKGVADARTLLDSAYAWLNQRMLGRTWASGNSMTLADCAAVPALFYADWVHPIEGRFAVVRDYRERLLAWPSIARTIDEARPYRHLFPQGAPDHD